MPLPQEPFKVDLTDFEFPFLNYLWSLTIEYEDQTNRYLPVIWKLSGSEWLIQKSFISHQFNADPAMAADALRGKWHSPAEYLRTLCDEVNAWFAECMTPPLPEPGNAASRTLYHAKVSLKFVDGKVTSPDDLNP